ncbi:hypothetical protein FHS79_000016 [Polymorphobacter multimanifer]|uniref:Outer membrane beta-barrel protein n=1 Tax=Polymorphobacter multimanifer TaxID=1070431 RepID=A0A841L7M6_9SPHN|nr:outer membrane beta-barrel protein [Polymorphobacter multimanifer]MBB6225865.1 hypothetical protein [Polymorphobacter multimanifer]
MTHLVMRGAAAGSLLSLLFAAVPAAAQSSIADDDPPLRDAGFIGVPQPEGRNFLLAGSLRTRYDTNFRRQTVARGASRITPFVEAGIGLPVGQQQLFVGGTLGRDVFPGNSRFNRNRYSIGAGGNLRAGSRCTANVGGQYSSQQLLQTDVADLEDNVQKRSTLGASFNCQAPVGIGFGASVIRRDARNERAQRSLFDFDTLSIAPQISYASPVLGTFTLSGSRQQVRYPNRLVISPDGPEQDGVDIDTARFGFSRALGTRLNLSLGASYNDVKPQPDGQLLLTAVPGQVVLVPRPGFKGAGFDAGLTLRVGARMSLAASGDRSVSGGGNVGSLFQVRNSFGIDADYRLSRALTAGVGGRMINNDYRGGFASVDEPIRRISDTTKRVYAQLAFSPTPRYSISTEIGHQTRDSNPELFSFSNTFGMLRMRVQLGRG